MNRRNFLVQTSTLTVGTLLFPSAFAQIQSMNEAINKSGRQRMLSQRMAKAYLQIGQGIAVERSRKILALSITIYERQLAELMAYAPTPENKQVFDEMEKVWGSYRAILTASTPNPDDAKNIMAVSDKALALAQKATVQLEKLSGTSVGKLVNISGRQRMLSQRVAKFYQAIQWNVAPSDAQEKLNVARREFVAGLDTLRKAPNNTLKINESLDLARQQWVFFDLALNDFGDAANKQQFANNVATTSERILEVMDAVTGMYEQIT
jgi:hypothetical protein